MNRTDSFDVELADCAQVQHLSNDEKPSRRCSHPYTNEEGEDLGEPVTRAQQLRILSSTCLVAFTVIGLNQSFGVFQAHYGRQDPVLEGVLLRGEVSQRPLISTIGSLGNGGIVAVFGLLYYPHLSRIGGHIRPLCFIGTSLIAAGFAIAAAASHNLATLVVCQGLLVGLGSGILIYVLSPILPEYFPQRSGLAQGVMFASAALGAMVWVLGLTKSLETLGVRWSLGVVAILSVTLLSVASALALPPRRFKRRCTSIVTWKTVQDPMFISLAVANLIHPLTLAIPLVFGPEFAESIGTSVTLGSHLLAINSGVGIPGRLCAGWLSDKLGHLNMLLMATAVYAVATWGLWLPAALKGHVGLYVAMCIFHGLVNGVFNTVMNSAQKTLFGAEMYYPNIGATTTIRGVGYVVGAPIAGAMVSGVANEDFQGSDFERPILYTAVLLTISLLCLVNTRRLDAKRNGWKLVR